MSDNDSRARHHTQLLASWVASLGGISVGMAHAWSTPAITFYKPTADCPEKLWKYIISAMPIGALAVQPLVGLLMYYLGRKKSMFIFAVLSIFPSLMFLYKNNTVYFVARILTGIFVGGFSAVVPVFIAEISHKSLRGFFGFMFQAQIAVGTFTVCAIGFSKSLTTLHIAMCLPPFCMALGIMFVKESPIWLYTNKKTAQAISNLRFYRGIDYDIKDEVAFLDRTLTTWNEMSFIEAIKQKYHWRGFLMVVGLIYTQQMTGSSAVTFYAPDIFKETRIVDVDMTIYTFAVMHVVFSLLGTGLVDRLGRKPLGYLSLSIMAISICAIGALLTIQRSDKDLALKLHDISTASICLFMIGYAAGTGPLGWLSIGELLSYRLVHIFAPLAAGLVYFFKTILTIIFPILLKLGDADGLCYFFGGMCILGLLFTAIFVIETKRMSAEEIQDRLEKKPKPEAT